MKKRFDIQKARALSEAIKRADDELKAYLALHFPKGYRCDVLLNARQKNPTPATIWGAEGGVYGGSIAIKIDNAKQWSRYSIRRLMPEQVLNVRPSEVNGNQASGGVADEAG